jgi:hypothetical protein
VKNLKAEQKECSALAKPAKWENRETDLATYLSRAKTKDKEVINDFE